MKPFEGRSVMVTGASSGLGAHFAGLMARGGAARLTLAARRLERLQHVAEICRNAGCTDVRVVPMDVTEEASVERAFVDAGGLDLLVNNAGVAETRAAVETTGEDFDRIIDANLRGAWICARQAALVMRASGRGGDIVNIASVLGLRVANGVAAYAVSKAGLIQMSRALALEWARWNIRVNALAPGYVETELNTDFFASDAGRDLIRRIPMRRLGRLQDLDAPFTLLASGASGYLTGAVLAVDGGHHVNSL